MKPTTRQTAALGASVRYRKEHGWEVLRDFATLLEIPNVTGDTHDLSRNAEELVRWFEARGGLMEIVELSGASPVVIGELRTISPTATLGVYVHYDGQPVDPANWTTSPFSPTLASGPWHGGGVELEFPGPGDEIDPEWRIYARAASDDKTPFAAMVGALDALEKAGIERSVDLVFLFEGEEESGSPNLGRYMKHLTSRLTADAWLLCDGPVHPTRVPQVAFGVRGYCGFELTFYGPERELHSGHYGNWVPNPAMELASFIAGCKDDTGTVTIDGFYDDTEPITAADRSAIDALPPVEDRLQAELGFGGPEVDGGLYPDRLMLPSFNVRGMSAGAVGQNARNVVPAEATVSVDIRLAAGDVPHHMLDLVEARLMSHGYEVLNREPTGEERRSYRYLAKLTRDAGYRAARIPMDSPLAETLLGVCDVASNDKVVALPTFGGSIPLYQFEEILNAPLAILPIANHDNNQHAPDENLRIANLWYGIDLWATILTTDFTAVGGSSP
ncbi:MAG: M20/M25/M40 family metallo-hydrolase [Acidimicrobiia bacterium]